MDNVKSRTFLTAFAGSAVLHGVVLAGLVLASWVHGPERGTRPVQAASIAAPQAVEALPPSLLAGVWPEVSFIFFTAIFGLVAYPLSAIFLALWVAKDARRRRIESPALWVVLMILTTWIGFIAYIAIRPDLDRRPA